VEKRAVSFGVVKGLPSQAVNKTTYSPLGISYPESLVRVRMTPRVQIQAGILVARANLLVLSTTLLGLIQPELRVEYLSNNWPNGNFLTAETKSMIKSL